MPSAAAVSPARLSGTEEGGPDMLDVATALSAEISRLKAEVERLQAENSSLQSSAAAHDSLVSAWQEERSWLVAVSQRAEQLSAESGQELRSQIRALEDKLGAAESRASSAGPGRGALVLAGRVRELESDLEEVLARERSGGVREEELSRLLEIGCEDADRLRAQAAEAAARAERIQKDADARVSAAEAAKQLALTDARAARRQAEAARKLAALAKAPAPTAEPAAGADDNSRKEGTLLRQESMRLRREADRWRVAAEEREAVIEAAAAELKQAKDALEEEIRLRERADRRAAESADAAAAARRSTAEAQAHAQEASSAAASATERAERAEASASEMRRRLMEISERRNMSQHRVRRVSEQLRADRHVQSPRSSPRVIGRYVPSSPLPPYASSLSPLRDSPLRVHPAPILPPTTTRALSLLYAAADKR
eukprot:TRINITY_DN20682_c0_g1_i2.p1 TRINITY_DN20682_c0_g1~~TRINITY_DN20682_c0_g1_i2.p1  ORF type:complete len:448 (+),score=192.45 TRINITY_DN20682_c0_g1_i2:62-1345(+)